MATIVTSSPCALDVGHAKGNAFVAFGHLAGRCVEHLVLEEHDQIVVADGAEQEPLGVGGGRGHDALDAGHVGEDRVVAAGVLAGGADPGADHGADHQRALGLAAEHVAQLGALVEDLVHAAAEEVDEHQLGDWAQAGGRGADGGADEAGLGDRGVQHPIAPELLDEPFGDAHHPAPGVVVAEVIDRGPAGDVLAEEDDRRVFAHGDAQRLVDGLLIRHLAGSGCDDHGTSSSRVEESRGRGVEVRRLSNTS